MTRPRCWVTVARLLLAAFMVGVLPPDLRAQTDTSGQPTTPQPTTPGQTAPGPQAASTPFQPPWTQEKQIPPEVKNKEKETPVAWCRKLMTDGLPEWEVSYYDSKSGATTTIKFRYRPGASGTGPPFVKPVWKITVKTPGQPKQETTYDLEPGKETKTVQTGSDPPKTTAVDPAKDLATPAKTTTAQAPAPGGGTPAPQTDQSPTPTTPGKTPTPTTPAPPPEQKPAGSTPQPKVPVGSTPTTPGPTGGPPPTSAPGPTPSTPQAGTTPPPTPSKPDDRTPTGPPPTTTAWNLKPVTWGGPPPDTTITYEPDHPTTPTQVAQRPEEPPGQPTPQNPWQPGDDQGPQTGIPTGGQPGGGQPGGG